MEKIHRLKSGSDLTPANSPTMTREKDLQHSIRAHRDEQDEYESSASENKDLDTIERGTDGSDDASQDTETTVSNEDVSNSCYRLPHKKLIQYSQMTLLGNKKHPPPSKK